MTLKRRLHRLERSGADGLVILMADSLAQADGDPVIRAAYAKGRRVERGADEDQDAFLFRVNPRAHPTATLEPDSFQL